MADPKAPEMLSDDSPLEFWHSHGTDGRAVIRMSQIRALLSAHGLHIVSEADKRVLDACAALSNEAMDMMRSGNWCAWGKTIAEAELEARKTRTP